MAQLRPERVFLLIAAAFGLPLLFANGPWQAPDEDHHFLRAIQISEGGWVPEKRGTDAGGELPAAADRNLNEVRQRPSEKVSAERYRALLQPRRVDWSRERRVFIGFSHATAYPPTAYMPQAAAIAAGRALHLGPLLLLYAARLAAFATAAALAFSALQRLPAFRWTALVLLTSPMCLYLFGSTAPDGELIAAAWLLAALIASPEPAGWRRGAAVLALAAWVSLAKTVYLPLGAAAAAAAAIRLPSWRARAVLGTAFAVFVIVPWITWAHVIDHVYVPGRTDIPIDPHAQVSFVLQHPLQYLELVVHSVWSQRNFIYKWSVGTLGWGDTPLPNWYYAVFGGAAAACFAAEAAPSRHLDRVPRLLLLTAAAATALLAITSQYLVWTSVGARDTILSLQGRYFLPIVPFVLTCVAAGPHWKPHPRAAAAIAAATSVLSGAVALWAVIVRYYIG